MRPGWDVEGGENAHVVDDHCFYMYCTSDGSRCPSFNKWEGMTQQGATEQGDRIGMLLDLDQGSMTEAGGDGGGGAERPALLGGRAG